MASARYALPFNSQAQLTHLHDQAVKHESGRQKKNADRARDAMKPRESAGVKFSRKMQSLFGGKKEHRASQEDEQAQEERKKAVLLRLVGNDAMVHAGRARFGRF